MLCVHVLICVLFDSCAYVRVFVCVCLYACVRSLACLCACACTFFKCALARPRAHWGVLLF